MKRILFISLIICYSIAFSTTINIPADYSTIQSGLNAAESSDTVLVQPGTYYECITWPDKNGIKLISAGDTNNTVINGWMMGSVISINPTSATLDTTTRIKGFTITNGGNVTDGGGIMLNHANIKIENSCIKNNSVSQCGGGMYLSYSNPTLSNVSIYSNYATSGGGMWLFGSNPTLTIVTIHSNSVDGLGGGMYLCNNSNPSLTNVSIYSNNSSHAGGGMCLNASSPTLTNVSIYNNKSTLIGNGRGGGMYLCERSNPTLNKVAIYNNTARAGGGGMCLEFSSSMLTNVTIYENACTNENDESYGGGMYIAYSDPILNNVNIYDNSASYGGGISLNSSSPSLTKAIISDNSASYGGGIFYYESAPTLTEVTIHNNICRNGCGGGMYLDNSNPTLKNGSIYNNKAFFNTLGGGIYLENNSNPILININLIANAKEAIYIESGNPTVSQCNIAYNEYGIFNKLSTSITDAKNNYWGHASGANHPGQNPNGQGDNVNMYVNVSPWLTEPDIDAPPIPIQNLKIIGSGNDFITLSWNSSSLTDLNSYRIYYDTDTTGFFDFKDSINVDKTDTSVTISGLASFTRYYFYGVTIDNDGNESWYSNRVSGLTRILEVQNLCVGENEDINHLVNHLPIISFKYYDSMNETQTHYQIQISKRSDFLVIDTWDTGIVAGSDTTVPYSGQILSDGVTYYMRVRVASSDFWSDWSSLVFRMNTVPSIPVLISPINNEVLTESIVLTINNSIDHEGDVLHYRFFLFDDVNLSDRLDSSDYITAGQGSTSWQVSIPLSDNQQYWWSAESFDGFESSGRSNPQSFLVNTLNNVPAKFSTIYPNPNSEIKTIVPTFSWKQSIDPDPLDTVFYSLYLDTPEPGIQIYHCSIDSFFLLTEPLNDNTDYYWQVIAKDKLGFETRNIEGYQKFTTNLNNENPSVAELISPDSVVCLDLNVKLYWTPSIDPDPNDTVSYEVHWSGDFLNPKSLLTDTNSVIISEVVDNAKHLWYVIAKDQNGGSSVSRQAPFWVDTTPEPPGGFTTISPLNGTFGLGSIEFVWHKSTDPDPFDHVKYEIVYTKDVNNSESFQYVPEIIDTTIIIEIFEDGVYYWKINAVDEDQFIVSSDNDEWQAFAVTDLEIDDSPIIPEKFALHSNFPNPFNPTTSIRYDIPKVSHVTLSIFNISGQVINILVNQKQEPGFYSVNWDARNVSTGVYFYKIQAGEFIQTKKCLLIK